VEPFKTHSAHGLWDDSGASDSQGLSPCGRLARRADPDRFLLAVMVPPDRREALFALLTVNAEAARIPDAVSEPLMGAMRLQYWRDVIAADDPMAAARGNPVAEALARDVLGEGGAPDLAERRALLEALLDGWGEALGADPPKDVIAARRHAAGIGGSLWDLAGLLMGVPAGDVTTRAALRHVGTAWLLLAMAKATPLLLQRGRLGLPLDALAHAGVSADTVLAGRDRDRVGIRAGVKALAGAAEEDLRAARSEKARADRRARPLLRQAIHARHLARGLAQYDHDPFAASLRLARAPVFRLLVSRLGGTFGL